MRYRYTKIAPHKSTAPWTRRPVLNLVLYGQRRNLDLIALLDSGADYCLFHTRVADALGIDLSRCERDSIEGIDAAPHETFLTEVELEVEDLPKVTVPAMFWEYQPISLIGQTGFFDLHRVTFERDHDVFEITPVER